MSNEIVVLIALTNSNSPYGQKMVVISAEVHDKICKFMETYKGLTIDCERELKKVFHDVDSQTVSAILSKEWQKRVKRHHHYIVRNATAILKE